MNLIFRRGPAGPDGGPIGFLKPFGLSSPYLADIVHGRSCAVPYPGPQ